VGRAVFFSFPSLGHITPGLAVVGQLAGRGEIVHVMATRRWQSDVERAGAAFEPYPREQAAFDPAIATSGLFEDMERLLGLTEEILPWAVDALRRLRPDYVLLDTKCVWGRLAAALAGVPAITLSVVFAIRPGVVPVPDLVAMLYGGGSAAAAFQGLRGFTRYVETASRIGRRWNLSSPSLVEFLGNPQPLNVIFTSRTLQPSQDAFDDRYEFVGGAVAPGGDDDLPSAIEALRDPLVYVSLGTTFNDAPAFYEACFAAFGDAPWQTVISTGRSRAALPEAPQGVVLCAFVPQRRVLERARVFVTHGGMNSVNEGLRAGVPLLVVPQRGDQFVVASRIAELGAGLELAPPDMTAPRLRASVQRLLTDSGYRRQAVTLGAQIREAGGASRAADRILGARRQARVDETRSVST
jgi:MGT family glycosyltransferase